MNLFLHSLFSQVDVSLNERLISPSTNTYPYRAMTETLFNYGGDAKSSQLSMAMFCKDTPGKMDVVDPVADDADANMGLKTRYTFTKESNTVDMMGSIHSDIFQDCLILNGVNLQLKLNRAKNSFCLVSSVPGYHGSNSIRSKSQSGLFHYSGTCSCSKAIDCQVPHSSIGL